MKAFAYLAALLLCSQGRVLAETKAAPAAPKSLKAQLTATPLDGVRIPAFAVDQTNLADVLLILTQQVKKSTTDVIQLQWIYKEIDPATWPNTVTLTGKNLSAAKILAEIEAQAKVKVTLEEHAIVIRPTAGAASKAPAKATPSDAEKKSPLTTPGLEKSSVESSAINDEYDKTPITGRNPVKK